MERKHGIALWAIIAACSLHAQPVMEQSDAPQDGQQLHYVGGQFTPITATGENQVWDLSGIAVPGAELTMTFLDPSVTGQANAFPTATVAMDDGTNMTYFRADATGLYKVGSHMVSSGLQFNINFTDEEQMLPFPCAYNTAYADSFHYNYSVLVQGTTISATGAGAIGYTATGFGSLVLPYTTLENVLMLSGSESLVESTSSVTYASENRGVIFYRPGIPFVVLRADSITLVQNGGAPQTGQSLSYLAQSTFAAIGEQARQAIGMDVWPVPARDQVQVAYGLGGGRSVDLQLRDATGKLVRQEQVRTAGAGIQQATVDVLGLPAGLYLLTLTDDRGQRGTAKVVVK